MHTKIHRKNCCEEMGCKFTMQVMEAARGEANTKGVMKASQLTQLLMEDHDERSTGLWIIS